MSEKELTRGEQFVLDYMMGTVGHFFKAIGDAAQHADGRNLARLREAFPDEVDALMCYRNEEGWAQALQVKIYELNGQKIIF